MAGGKGRPARTPVGPLNRREFARVVLLAGAATSAARGAALLGGGEKGQDALVWETFEDEQLTEGIWDARFNRMPHGQKIDPTMTGDMLAGFNNLGGGYLHFWQPARGGEPPSLYSRQAFARRPGRCLAVAYCGTIHRGGSHTVQFANAIRPADRLRAGPGWAPGQRQGPSPYINTLLPFGEGGRGPALGNNNLDTLLLVVLRERGAFYLVANEPDTPPGTARLWFVSHAGEGGSYHAALHGGQAHGRFHGAAVVDLPGAWTQEHGVATVVDRFRRASLGRPERGGTPWQAEGRWQVRDGALAGEGLLLTDAGTADQQVEALVTPGEGTRMVGLALRAAGPADLLRFELTGEGARLVRRAGAEETVLARRADGPRLQPGRPVRLAARLEGNRGYLCVDDAVVWAGEVPAGGGTRAGVTAAGEARFAEFVHWPCRVPLPTPLGALLPPIVPRADGEVILHDDFDGPEGSPLDGRRPTRGGGTWRVAAGEWSVRGGAATLGSDAGAVYIDAGAEDYEVTATIRLVGSFDFPGIVLRAEGPNATGGIHARYLWQDASPEIEVWDVPAATPENRRRWGERLPSTLINATNITGLVQREETRRLRVVVRGNRVSYFHDDLLVGTAPTRCTRGTWVGLKIAPRGNPRCHWLDFTVRAFRGETR